MFLYLAILVVAVVLSLVLICLVRIVIERRLQRDQSGRGLFTFHDGKRFRSIDPIEVMERMEADEKYRFDLHPKRVSDGDKEAIKETISAVRRAFGVAEFTAIGKPGLTGHECLALWNHFCLFLMNQKKSTDAPLT